MIVKSKAIRIFDFHDIDVGQYAEPFSMSEEELEGKLKKLLLRHAETIDADMIEADDIVTIDTVSETPRFNKKGVQLKAGRGLYSRELEAELMGMRVGEEKAVTIPEGEVTVTVISVKRKVLPELTDEIAASLGIDGVNTVAGLKNHIEDEARAQYVEDVTEGIAVAVSNELNERSEFELDPDELETVRAEGKSMADDMLRSSGLDPETATDEEVTAVAGQCKASHYAFLDAISVDGLKSAVIGSVMMERDGEVIQPGEYEEAVKFCAGGMGLTEKEAETVITYPKFLRQRAGNYCFEAIVKYVKEYFERK